MGSVFIRGLTSALTAGLVACGGAIDGSQSSAGGAAGLVACPAGTESCPCTSRETCAANLACVSHLCVSSGAGGALAVGGGTSTGGIASVGGARGGKTIATPEVLAAITNAACTGTNGEVDLLPALLEFVVDVSGSMNTVVAGSTQSRWEITKAALASAISTGLPDNTGVGVLFFPNMNTIPNHNTTPVDITNCVNTSAMIPAAPLGVAGSSQRATIAQGLATAFVAGGAPTDDAYEYAYSSGFIPTMQMYGYFQPFIVLITDGQPTISLGCEGTGQTTSPVDWHPIVNDISAAFNNTPQVKTFIVGSPGSESQSSTGADGRPWLSLAARTGGTQITPDCVDTGPNYCHFDMSQSTDFAADLSAALSDIMRAAIPCSVVVPPPSNGAVPNPNAINVIYEQNVVGGMPTYQWLIGQTSDISCAGGSGDGWYVDPSTGKVVLCPVTCKTVQSDKYARLKVYQGCLLYAPPGGP
jgi:hypothetical protein